MWYFKLVKGAALKQLWLEIILYLVIQLEKLMTAEYKLHLAVFCVVFFKDRGKSLSLLTVISNLICFCTVKPKGLQNMGKLSHQR